MPIASDPGITADELRLAARNHALPLEALRYEITPVGLHYLLIHFDIPHVDAAAWRLELGGRVARPLSLTLDVIANLIYAGLRDHRLGFVLLSASGLFILGGMILVTLRRERARALAAGVRSRLRGWD